MNVTLKILGFFSLTPFLCWSSPQEGESEKVEKKEKKYIYANHPKPLVFKTPPKKISSCPHQVKFFQITPSYLMRSNLEMTEKELERFKVTENISAETFPKTGDKITLKNIYWTSDQPAPLKFITDWLIFQKVFLKPRIGKFIILQAQDPLLCAIKRIKVKPIDPNAPVFLNCNTDFARRGKSFITSEKSFLNVGNGHVTFYFQQSSPPQKKQPTAKRKKMSSS